MIRTLVCIQAVLLDFYLLLHESHTKIKVSTAATDGETLAQMQCSHFSQRLHSTQLYALGCWQEPSKHVEPIQYREPINLFP